jgi:hypothetical protein
MHEADWPTLIAALTIGFITGILAVLSWRRSGVIGPAELPRLERCPICNRTIHVIPGEAPTRIAQ